jgi:hypothetical protein
LGVVNIELMLNATVSVGKKTETRKLKYLDFVYHLGRHTIMTLLRAKKDLLQVLHDNAVHMVTVRVVKLGFANSDCPGQHWISK